MADKDIVILHARTPGAKAETRGGTFTGVVWGDPLLPAQDNVLMNTVYFSPCSRTYWHSHEGGQMLHVTSGEGWVCQRGEAPIKIQQGDTIWTPPGTDHWHGSDNESFMVHIAMSLGTTNWVEEVGVDEFDGLLEQVKKADS
jgi:quercetin dioxygenase-like cupin family protein